MTLFKTIITACFAAFLFASCGADTKEKIAQDSFSAMEEMVSILETISDKASAEAAKPKLEALVSKVDGLKARAKALNISDDEMKKEMEKNKEKMGELMGKMMGTMMKIGMNKEVQEVLGDTMNKLNK